MKLASLALCCALIILKQNVDGATKGKLQQLSKITVPEEENEEQDKGNSLLDLIEKGLDSQEDVSDLIITPPRPKPKNKIIIKMKQKIKQLPPKKFVGSKSSAAKSTKSRKSLMTHRKSSYLKNYIEGKNHFSENGFQTHHLVNGESEKAENTVGGGERRYSDDFLEAAHNRIVGSVEDETLEEDIGEGGRKDLPDRKFETVYRYENEPLKNMLVWLIMNSQNPTIKNAVKASKTSIDRYVKHTVDKAAGQSSLRYADYSSVRFDKDRIVMYCGGKIYVYNTLKDSKICFNGQVQEVRLI